MTGSGPSRRMIVAWLILSVPFTVFLLFGFGEPDPIHLGQAAVVLIGALLGRRYPRPAGIALILFGLLHAVLLRASIFGLTAIAGLITVGGIMLLTSPQGRFGRQ